MHQLLFVCFLYFLIFIDWWHTGLVSREVEHVKVHSPPSSGVYRSKLNSYQQCGRISSFTWHDEEQKDIKGAKLGFTSWVVVSIKDGHKIECNSQGMYSSKSTSREAAASKAISVLEDMPVSLPTVHSICSGAEILVYKSKLNNMMQGTLRTQLPDYDTRQLGEQEFQCTVKHSTFGEVTGSVCNSKREAENVAAHRAYSFFI